MTDRGSGARSSNVHNVRAFVNELAERERTREFKDPVSAFTRFSMSTSEKLEKLDGKVQSAKAAISKATERRSNGELDDSTYYAETIAARMLVSMQSSLVAIYARAKPSKDIFAVRRVGVVADKLAAVSDELLMEFHYPHDESLKQTLVEQNVRTVRDVHADAVQSLQGVHDALGVTLAEFPAPGQS